MADVSTNLFTDSKICSLGVSFIENERVFSYDFKFDSTIVNGYKRAFIYEKFKELYIDKYGNESEKLLFVRDVDKGVYRFNDNNELSQLLNLVSNDNILIYTINSAKYQIVDEYKSILRNFALKLDILDMNNIPIEKTIRVLKDNEPIKAKTVELIKLADLDIDDYLYLKNPEPVKDDNLNNAMPIEPREAVLRNAILMDDMLRLTSVHKGKALRSLSIDSTGTKKIVAAASYIIDALTNGRTLIIDELDSSLHYKLTRAIVSLFNNELNKEAQLIFTAHDYTLLDCKKLFRKDQIWFAAKDEEGEYLYSLSDFTAKENKVRSSDELFEKYNAGVFGSIPEPDLISVLFSDD